MDNFDITITLNSTIIVAVCTLIYLIGGAIYRLYLCPIASFPGPKLAALTGWYESYYDVILTGSYLFKIEKMHDKYGMFYSFMH